MPTDLLDKSPPAPPRAAQPAANEGRVRSEAVETLLGETSRPRWRRALRPAVLVLLIAAGLYGGLALYRHMQVKPAQYATSPVRRGDLAVVVTVTGNLAPVNQVDVGSELSGTVDHIYVE